VILLHVVTTDTLTNVARGKLALLVWADAKRFGGDRRLLEVPTRQIVARHHHFPAAPALSTLFVEDIAGQVRAAVGVAEVGARHQAHVASAYRGAAGPFQAPAFEGVRADDAASFRQTEARVHARPEAGFNEGLGFAVQRGATGDDDAQTPA